MCAPSVVIEDAQDLGRSAVRLDGVRDHGGELGRLARFDPDGALAEEQRDGSRQDGEPVLAGVYAELVGPRALSRSLSCVMHKRARVMRKVRLPSGYEHRRH